MVYKILQKIVKDVLQNYPSHNIPNAVGPPTSGPLSRCRPRDGFPSRTLSTTYLKKGRNDFKGRIPQETLSRQKNNEQRV